MLVVRWQGLPRRVAFATFLAVMLTVSALLSTATAFAQASDANTNRATIRLSMPASDAPAYVCVASAAKGCASPWPRTPPDQRDQIATLSCQSARDMAADPELGKRPECKETAAALAKANPSAFSAVLPKGYDLTCARSDGVEAGNDRVLILKADFIGRRTDAVTQAVTTVRSTGGVVAVSFPAKFDVGFFFSVVGGDYLPDATSLARVTSVSPYAELPVFARTSTRRLILPPGWPASGRLAAELTTREKDPVPAPALAVEAGTRVKLPARIGDNRVRVDLVGEGGAVLASSVVDYSTPLPAEGAAARFTKTSFTWIANPLADDGDCPTADLPEAGVICTSRFRPIKPRSCRYTCESISPSSYVLPTPIRFRHARSGGEWTEALKSGAESEVGGYVTLADRILRVRFSPGWPDNGFQVGLTLEDGTNDLFPAIGVCREASASECVTTVSVRGLRSGAVVRVKTFGPRTYNAIPIRIKTETTDAIDPPEERRRGASFHFGAGASLALINRTPEGKEGDWFPLPGLAISGGGSYAWRDKFQLEGNLAARLMERPVIPFETDTGGPVVSEKLVYIHLSWQTLFLFRPMRQIQFGGGPGVDVAFPAVRANTYRGGGNDWMLSLNGSFRLQPFSYSRLMFVVDTNFYPATELPVWTVARTGAVTASDEGHVPFLVGLGMRGEWSPFGN